MKVVPAINCESFECVSEKILLASEFADWLQIDVADGKFSPALTWNNPEKLAEWLKERGLNIKVEAHLMVENVLGEALRWLKAGAKRIVVQAGTEFDYEKLLAACGEYRAEAMLSFSPQVSLDDNLALASAFREFQVLAVSPGFAGQKFDDESTVKIKSLRRVFPDVIIEVDGGINPATAEEVKSAGADIVVSASYIFENKNPREAFAKLSAI
jgi:ribulose-phosphate 3-epimerase